MSFTMCNLVVAFERDMDTLRLPYLGQATLLGHIGGLLKGYPVCPPRSFISVCASPEVSDYVKRALDDGQLVQAFQNEFPFEVPLRWFDAEDGWKMVVTIRQALATDRVESIGLLAIAGELNLEAEVLGTVLEQACRGNIRFNLDLEECSNQPLKLKEWVAAEMAELAQDIIRIMKDSGIDID